MYYIIYIIILRGDNMEYQGNKFKNWVINTLKDEDVRNNLDYFGDKLKYELKKYIFKTKDTTITILDPDSISEDKYLKTYSFVINGKNDINTVEIPRESLLYVETSSVLVTLNEVIAKCNLDISTFKK